MCCRCQILTALNGKLYMTYRAVQLQSYLIKIFHLQQGQSYLLHFDCQTLNPNLRYVSMAAYSDALCGAVDIHMLVSSP